MRSYDKLNLYSSPNEKDLKETLDKPNNVTVIGKAVSTMADRGEWAVIIKYVPEWRVYVKDGYEVSYNGLRPEKYFVHSNDLREARDFTQTQNSENEVTGENNISENTNTNTNTAFKESGIAKVGTTSYQSLHDAINAVKANNTKTTIKLLNNVNSSENTIEYIKENQNIELDLNGFYIYEGTYFCVLENGTLSVINEGKIEGGNQSLFINYGQLNIVGGNIISKVLNITNGKNGTLNISGGKIISEGVAIKNSEGGLVNITGGEINSTYDKDVTINNRITSGQAGKIKISGGKIISTNYFAIDNWSELEISRGRNKFYVR